METVDKLLKAGVFNAVVIYREIQALGYDGKIRVLAYIEPRRALRPGRATVRFETEPAKQLQHDWGQVIVPIAGTAQRVHIAVSVLGYSRRFHVMRRLAVTPSIPVRVWYERSLVRRRHPAGMGRQPQGSRDRTRARRRALQRTLQATGPPLRLRAEGRRPYRPRTKGKVERLVGYFKQHFFQRYRDFESWAHLGQLLEAWLLEEADQRLHGTVKEVVADASSASDRPSCYSPRIASIRATSRPGTSGGTPTSTCAVTATRCLRPTAARW